MDLGQVQSFCPFLLLVKPSLPVHHWLLRTVIDKQCFGHVLGSCPSLEPHCQPLPGLVPVRRPEQCRSLKYTPPSQRCRADPCSPSRSLFPVALEVENQSSSVPLPRYHSQQWPHVYSSLVLGPHGSSFSSSWGRKCPWYPYWKSEWPALLAAPSHSSVPSLSELDRSELTPHPIPSPLPLWKPVSQ